MSIRLHKTILFAVCTLCAIVSGIVAALVALMISTRLLSLMDPVPQLIGFISTVGAFIIAGFYGAYYSQKLVCAIIPPICPACGGLGRPNLKAFIPGFTCTDCQKPF